LRTALIFSRLEGANQQRVLKCLAGRVNRRISGISTREIGIHFPGLDGLSKPRVLVYPKLMVCLGCGFTEFAIPETELRRLVENDPSAAA
jgi:hypothetical protein